LRAVLHALITFAAEMAEEGAEPSKALFYIAGGGLTLWAVVVSFVGIRSHENWPANDTTARAIMAVSGVLVVFTMAASVLTS